MSTKGSVTRHRFAHQTQGEDEQSEEVEHRSWKMEDGRWTADFLPSPASCLFDVTRIGPQGQHRKERAEQVLAFSYPSDGLNAERVQPKKRCYEQAPPEDAGQSPENYKDQDCSDCVKQHACQVMSPTFRPKELAVCHVREPGKRMPVTGVIGGQGPSEACPTQSAVHVGIGSNVNWVIVVYKIIVDRRQENPRHEQAQQEAKPWRRVVARESEQTLGHKSFEQVPGRHWATHLRHFIRA